MTILYLDVDDEITSAATRIRSVEGDHVALVLPFGSRLATSRINFKLLAREASERGKAIEVIAADPSARALATSAGLTVHPSVAAFEAGGTAPAGETAIVPVPAGGAATGVILIPKAGGDRVPVVGRVPPPVRPRLAVGIAAAAVALILVGGFLAFTLLPSATIILSPWSRQIGPEQLSIVADPSVTTPDSAALAVPAQRMTFQLAIQQTFPASGKKVTDVKATGTVEFSNFDNNGGVLIPAGTIVRTDSKIAFKTLADLILPRAGQDFFPPFAVHPSTGSVGIEAVVAGPSGNVGNNTITTIPAAGSRLRVINAAPTTGGAHNVATVVSQDDVDKALAALNAALGPELDRQIAGTPVPSGTTLYPETKTIGASTPSVDPATLVGQETAQFDLGVSAEGSILGVDSGPVHALAESHLRGQVESGWTLADASTSVRIGEPAVAGERVTFPVTLSAAEVRTVDRATLLAEVQGLGISAARSRLGAFGAVEIRPWPDWVTTIPANVDRVTLTIGDPTPEPSPSP